MELQKNIAWEIIESIGVLSIHNPPENYIEEPEFIKIELLKEVTADEGLKGIIIKGSGRHFSAGADLNKLRQLAHNTALLTKKMTDGKKVLDFIENLSIPVIASISGVCFGGGLEIALACHIRICADNALFAFPESNHDIMPGLGGTVRITRLIGPGKSAEMTLSGEMVNAQQALEIKLADHIVPSKELMSYSLNFLKKLTADRDIEVIHSVMKSINNSRTMPFEKAIEEESKLFCKLAVKNLK